MEFNDSVGSITSLVKINTTVAPMYGNVTNILEIVGNGGITIPKGTTAQQPASVAGMIRYNTDIHSLEVNNGVYWGAGPNPQITLTTTSTTTNQVVDSIPTSVYRTVKYIIQVTSGSVYQTSEVLIIHDGTTPSITEYASILTGANLATFDTAITTGNLELLVTPVNAVTTIKVIRFAITI